MILKESVREISIVGEEITSHKMHVSDEAMNHMIRMATEHSYQQPLESGIREAVSNAIDSHIEAGVDIPVIVRLQKNSVGQYVLEIIDEGLGLDEFNFNKYIMGVGESTKRLRADLLGGFGAGAKAFCSYTNQYEYTCRKDGIERKFLIFKGDEIPEYTKLYEKETSEHNGVIVSVTLNNNWNEFQNCVRAIKEQLPYLPNVYYDIPGFDNQYSIYKQEHFMWNNLQPCSEMHISLKNIYYPINWSKLGIEPIMVPVALRFDDYSELQPIFNREQLKWDAGTKEAIFKKIRIVADFFINKWNSDAKVYDTLFDAWKQIGGKNHIVEIEGKTFVIDTIQKYSSIKKEGLKVKGISLKSPSFYKENFSVFLDEYIPVDYFNGNSWSKKSWPTIDACIRPKDFSEYSLIVTDRMGLTQDLKKYYAEQCSGEKTLFIHKHRQRKISSSKFSPSRSYEDIYGLTDTPLKEWRAYINEFLTIKNNILKRIPHEEKVELSESFLEFKEEMRLENIRKRAAQGKTIYESLNKQLGQVSISYLVPKDIGTGMKFYKRAYDVLEVSGFKHLSVYSLDIPDNSEEFEMIKELEGIRNVKFCKIGVREYNKVKHIKNFITVKQFMSLDNVKDPNKRKPYKPFVRTVTKIKVDEVLLTVDSLKNNTIVEDLIKNLHEDILYLQSYSRENSSGTNNLALRDSMIEIANDLNLYDLEVMAVINRVKEAVDKYDFIELLEEPSSYGRNSVENRKKYFNLINQILLLKKLKIPEKYPEFEIKIINKEEEVDESIMLEDIADESEEIESEVSGWGDEAEEEEEEEEDIEEEDDEVEEEEEDSYFDEDEEHEEDENIEEVEVISLGTEEIEFTNEAGFDEAPDFSSEIEELPEFLPEEQPLYNEEDFEIPENKTEIFF